MNFRKSLKNKIFLFGLSLFLVGIYYFQHVKSQIVKETPTPAQSPQTIIQSEDYRVIKVYDGDTIEIEGGLKVRYIGIDTSEVYPKVQCYSLEAKKENENLVLGKEIRMVKDSSETDKYGRLLRYVYIGDDFINNDLVKKGFAKIMTIPPDTKYKDIFLESQSYAKENGLGLWRNCP